MSEKESKKTLDRSPSLTYCKRGSLLTVREGIDFMMNDLPNLSKKEISILEMLIGTGEMYGLEMVEASGGILKRGTIYVTLQRMSDKGFVTSREEPRSHPEVGIARRKYSVSGLGQRAYQANIKAREYFNSSLVWEI